MEISGKPETTGKQSALRVLPLCLWLTLVYRHCVSGIAISIRRAIVARRLAGQFLPALFFLLGFLCQIALAFFELVVGFGQGSTFAE